MKIEEVWRRVARFENGQVLLPQMTVFDLAGVLREEKRQVRVVRVQQPHVPEVVGVIAGHCGKEGVQQVVAFLDQHGVVRAEHSEALGGAAPELGAVEVIKNDRERKLAKVVAAYFELT